MTAPDFRCSLAALDLGEPMTGTASTVRAFLLVEAPGAWGVDAVAGARLPSDVRTLLSGLGRNGVRVLMIRDHRRRTPETVRVFAAYVGADRPWVETAELADVRELLDLRLAGLGAGESPGWRRTTSRSSWSAPTASTTPAAPSAGGRCAGRCTTWRRRRRGRSRTSAATGSPRTCSCCRTGSTTGGSTRRTPRRSSTPTGRASSTWPHLRGRSSFGFRVQAAETFLRTHTGERGLAAPELLAHERDGDVTRVELRLAGRRWAVRVATRRTPARQLTCRAVSSSEALEHSLLGIEPLDRLRSARRGRRRRASGRSRSPGPKLGGAVALRHDLPRAVDVAEAEHVRHLVHHMASDHGVAARPREDPLDLRRVEGDLPAHVAGRSRRSRRSTRRRPSPRRRRSARVLTSGVVHATSTGAQPAPVARRSARTPGPTGLPRRWSP